MDTIDDDDDESTCNADINTANVACNHASCIINIS